MGLRRLPPFSFCFRGLALKRAEGRRRRARCVISQLTIAFLLGRVPVWAAVRRVFVRPDSANGLALCCRALNTGRTPTSRGRVFIRPQVALRAYFVQISMLLKSDRCSQCTNSIRSLRFVCCRQTATASPTAPGLNQDVIELVELSGIEPLTPCVQGRCSPG